MHLSRKSSGPELEESTTNFARIGFRSQEFRCEHPAGRSLFWIKRDKNYDWKHKPVRQFDFRTEYWTVWLIPGKRLADWVSTLNQNNKRSFWMNRRTRPDLPRLPAFFVSSIRFYSSIKVFLCFLECLFDSNMFLWEICKYKKDFRYKWSKKLCM